MTIRAGHVAASFLLALLATAPASAQTDPVVPVDPAAPDEFIHPPLTIRAVGIYRSSLGGDARLDMASVTTGTLALGGKVFTIVGNVDLATLEGATSGNVVAALNGTTGGKSRITLKIEVGTTGNLNVV